MGRLAFTLLLLTTLCPGCAYLTDRGMDFLDQYRFTVGASTGGGVRFSTLGLVHTGLMFGIKPQASAFGWKYGRPLLLTGTATPAGIEADHAQILFTSTFEDWDYASNEFKLARKSFFLLPALLTRVDTTRRSDPVWYVPAEGVELRGDHYLWSAVALRDNRYAAIHAFDTELEIAVLVYLDLGYSPGEFLDFLLGIFTIDLAKDDGRIYGGEEG